MNKTLRRLGKTTKAIKTKALNGEKMTKPEKLRVLKDARKAISDPGRWAREAYLVSENGSSSLKYPSEQEEGDIRMCVMGALAVSCGMAGEVSETLAGQNLVQCSLGAIMTEALSRVSHEITEDDIYESWSAAQFGGGVEGEDFDKFLKRHKMNAFEWYAFARADFALDLIYGFNDSDETDHDGVLMLLDSAIDILEGK